MGGGKGDSGAGQARADEQARQERVRTGTQRIDDIFAKQFDDPFYAKRRQGFLDYATPQLDSQYNDAQKQLVFDLARNGTLSSSIRGARMSDLQKLYDTNRQQVQDQALSYENQARNNVESARGNLVTTLNANGDAEGAASSAINRAQVLSAPDAYSPLGQLFTSFTSTLGQQAAQERAAALSGGTYKPAYNTGLFGNAGRVTVKR